MAMVFGGMKPMKTTSFPLPDVKTDPTTQQQPNSASQAMYFTLLLKKNITLTVGFY
jgi:hypothetical protein